MPRRRNPPGFAEWNDKFRDGVRRFWRGDAGQRVVGHVMGGEAAPGDYEAARAAYDRLPTLRNVMKIAVVFAPTTTEPKSWSSGGIS